MNLPPYLSRTPPPVNNNEDDENEDEEFGSFVVSSDLGEDVFEGFDKASSSLRGEDNVSEDSGFCMNSFCQTQSPCDISPLSSSYPTKGPESTNDDTPESTVIDCETLSNTGTKDEGIKPQFSNGTLPQENNVSVTNTEEKNSENDNIYQSELMPSVSSEKQNNCFVSNCDSTSYESETNSHVNVNKTETDFEVSKNCSFIQESEVSLEPKDEFVWDCFSSYEAQGTVPPVSSVIVSDSNLSETLGSHSPNTENIQANEGPLEQSIAVVISDKEVPSTGILSQDGNVSVDDWGSDDDFSEFAGFQSTSNCVEEPSIELFQKKESPFPELPNEGEGSVDVNIPSILSSVQTSIVWNFLQCFEDTPACRYQWSSSSTKLKFLQALQIDSRNIFHGPWSKINRLQSSEVPSYCDTNFSTFASDCNTTNLRFGHQEPSVPDPHFDWLSSGLVNPLQVTSSLQHTTGMRIKNISGEVNRKKKDLLASLPTLTYVKAHHIVFKRD